MGFARGSILEPGCGTGQFLALRPEGIEDCSTVTGIEMDPVTARIAALLYPKAWIRNEDFCRAKLAETFDLAIGNPPFSDRTVRAEDPAGRLGLKLHDYVVGLEQRLQAVAPASRVRPVGTLAWLIGVRIACRRAARRAAKRALRWARILRMLWPQPQRTA